MAGMLSGSNRCRLYFQLTKNTSFRSNKEKSIDDVGFYIKHVFSNKKKVISLQDLVPVKISLPTTRP